MDEKQTNYVHIGGLAPFAGPMEFKSLMGFIGYPEILLSVFCFLFLRHLCRSDRLPVNWPFVGMLPALLSNVQNVHDYTTEVLKRSGGTFLVKGPWFSNMDMLHTCNPDNVHYIMSKNFSNFPKGSEFKRIFDIFGDGIFNSDSDSWRTQRKFSHSLLNHSRFRQFLAKTTRNEVEKRLIPVLEYVADQGLVVDLQDVFGRFTYDTTSILVSGADPACLSVEFPEVRFIKAMDDAERAILFRHVVPESCWKLQRSLTIGEERQLSQAWATLDQFIAKDIAAKREKLSNIPRTNTNKEDEDVDLLTSYMGDEQIGGLKSDKFLRDTILNFMIAGKDTTAAALTWFVWLVCQNPLVETKILDELTAKIPERKVRQWRVFDADELVGLVYLHGALCESLRLFPPVPFQHKSPISPDVLPTGHEVRPGTKILLSLYAMGRMENIWGKDCLEFKPERWISEQGGIKHEPSYKFMAFNAGPRTCLGKEIAFTQMKAVAAAIIYNYHVQVEEGHLGTPNHSLILQMKHGLKVRITKRWL